MSFLDQICVLILTLDEEANLERTLAALARFPRIVVLDSGSTDATGAIAARHPNVRTCLRPFDGHAAQWNHGLAECGTEASWVLALDADYVLEPALVDEIAALAPAGQVSGYRPRFSYCIAGQPLSGTLYPPQVVLFRRARARFTQEGHTQRLVLDGGDVLPLAGRILHDDRKPLSRWLRSQQRYAALEASHLLATPRSGLGLTGRIRRLGWAAPLLVFAYTLLAKRCILDGRAGWTYVLQRTLAEIMIALELLDRRRTAGPDKPRP